MNAAPARLRVFLLALCWLIACSRGQAIIEESTRVAIAFTDPTEAAANATWSDPEMIAVSESGLGWDGDANASRDGWIQTKPIALGYAWQPAHAIILRAVLLRSPGEITRTLGQTTIVDAGSLYVRYSPDRRHWSSWQALELRFDVTLASEKGQTPGLHYSGRARVPERDRQEYLRRLLEYRQMDVPWKSDEEAAVKWMLGHDPDLFAKNIPFIGYVEFLYEASFVGGRRIQNLNVYINYNFGGYRAPLRDGSYHEPGRAPWRYQDPGLSPPVPDAPTVKDTPAR